MLSPPTPHPISPAPAPLPTEPDQERVQGQINVFKVLDALYLTSAGKNNNNDRRRWTLCEAYLRAGWGEEME